MRYRLRTLLIVLATYRVQITLVLGFVGGIAAYWCWLGCEWSGWPAALRPLAIILGLVSAAALIEDDWKLGD
jgi:hypothetical protein